MIYITFDIVDYSKPELQTDDVRRQFASPLIFVEQEFSEFHCLRLLLLNAVYPLIWETTSLPRRASHSTLRVNKLTRVRWPRRLTVVNLFFFVAIQDRELIDPTLCLTKVGKVF